MDEQARTELLTYLKETGEKLSDFASTQGPLVAQEIVGWYRFKSFIEIVIGVVLLTIGGSLFILSWRVGRGLSYGDKRDAKWAAATASAIVGVVLSLFSVPCLIEGYVGLVKSSTAPRLVVIDYLKSSK